MKKKRTMSVAKKQAAFVANKKLADSLAKRRGGKCLSGPQRKNDQWLWKCKDPAHKAWRANWFQIAGSGKTRGKGSWCRACSASGWAKRRKTRFAENKQLANKLAKKKDGRCLSSPRRKHDKWLWKCSNTEHSVWQATLWQIQGTGKKAGSWCPQCVGRNVPRKVYQAWAKRFGGKVVKQAKTTTEVSLWWCKHHGEFRRIFNNMKTTGSFCQECGASLGERKCKAAMEQLFGKKFQKCRFPQLKGLGGKSLEIDLYNEELRLGLEHQGAQHFIRKKYFGEHRFGGVREHDRRKRAYCKKNGITLIEVRQVGEVTPDSALKDTIRAALLAEEYPIPPAFDRVRLRLDVAALPTLAEEKWEETKREALRRGWKVVSKRYLGSLTVHEFVCDKGHRLKTKPSYILQGQGCKKCDSKPVVLNDARVFDSLSQAAQALDVSISTVSDAVRRQGRVAGFRVSYIDHQQVASLRGLTRTERRERIARLFAALPVGPKVGEANGKPVLLGDGRIFSSSHEAARAVGVRGNVAYAAATRPKGKIKGIRIAQITNEQREAFQKKPSLIAGFWEQRPLGPRKFMTRRRGVLTSLKEVFEGVREVAEALGVTELRICDYARRGKELKGRTLWYLSQEELALLRDRKVKPAELLERKKIHGHAAPTFNKRKNKKP
jgi:hypothetical protein